MTGQRENSRRGAAEERGHVKVHVARDTLEQGGGHFRDDGRSVARTDSLYPPAPAAGSAFPASLTRERNPGAVGRPPLHRGGSDVAPVLPTTRPRGPVRRNGILFLRATR